MPAATGPDLPPACAIVTTMNAIVDLALQDAERLLVDRLKSVSVADPGHAGAGARGGAEKPCQNADSHRHDTDKIPTSYRSCDFR